MKRKDYESIPFADPKPKDVFYVNGIEVIQNPNVLITDVFTDRFFFDGLPHMILSDAVELADSIGAQSAYFSHCSHRTPPHDIFDKTVSDINKNYHIAYDGLQIMLPPLEL